MVLDIGKDEGPRPKCYVHHGYLPSYIDSSHPPTKKEPFRTVAEHRTSHTLDVLLPVQSGSEDLDKSIKYGQGLLQYAKVHMKLGDILTGDFFNEYIKKGNILMLAEGRSDTDHTFTLADGVLRVEIDKATFERTGLEGKSIPSDGRKHVKARYVIELNLRLPSMVRGKKGFERILWACKNVFEHSMTWLFYDLNVSAESLGPITSQAPISRSLKPSIRTIDAVLCPEFPDAFTQKFEEDASDLLEWISIVTSGSPRSSENERVDEYICRYHVPVLTDPREDTGASQSSYSLVHYRWHGFIPSEYVTKILLATFKASGETWCAISAASFDSRRYTILKHKDQVTTWKYSD